MNIEQLHGFLNEWTQSGDHLQPDIANYLQGPLPGRAAARLGRLAAGAVLRLRDPRQPGQLLVRLVRRADRLHRRARRNGATQHGEKLRRLVAAATAAEIHHFIGKDITYFHTLFWPAMLKAAGFKLPRQGPHPRLSDRRRREDVEDQGHLRPRGDVSGTSRPAYLRYYYASKLTPKLDDLDLNLDEFVDKMNSDLVGKVVNLASRTARFVETVGLSDAYPDDGGLFAAAAEAGEAIAAAYEACDYNRAMRAIMGLADRANQYVDDNSPVESAQRPGAGGRGATSLHGRA